MIEDGFNQPYFGNSPTIVYKCLHSEPTTKTLFSEPKANKIYSFFSWLFPKENQLQISEIKTPSNLQQ